MQKNIEYALEHTLENWKYMLDANIEPHSDEFMTSFYELIRLLREWVKGLDQQPKSLSDFEKLPLIQKIMDQLPDELHLNVRTELGLILEELKNN